MDTAKKILRIYSRYKIYIFLLIVGIPILSQLNIWSQTVLGRVVDSIAEDSIWLRAAGIYAVAAFAHFLMEQGYSIVEQQLSFHVIYNLRSAIAKKVLRTKSEELYLFSSDDVMQMWNNDVGEIQSVSVNSIFHFLILVCSAALALVELYKISLYFPLIALATNILAIFPVKMLGRKNKQRSQSLRESQITMNEKFYRILNGIRLVKSYGKEKREVDEFEKFNNHFVDDKLGSMLSRRIYKSVITALNSIAPTIILLIANFEIRDGRMTIGDIVLATSLLATISKPFTEGGNFIINIKTIGFKFDHLFDLLEKEEEDSSGKALETDRPYELGFDNVSYTVNGHSILENISLSIHSGEKVAIVGESGSGKTTLNNLILRLYAPTGGTLLLNGTDINAFDLRSYREGIHYSQSNTYISNATIMQNLALLGADENSCIQLAKEIHFHQEILAMTDGYNTVVDADGSNISGGQKRKIAIIRALTQRRNLYIFDEVTRGIDEPSAIPIMNYLLDNIASTAIFTMHNFFAIELMDKIIVMRAGHIVAEGKHEELYESCDYYRELFDNRRRGDDE